jgi:hypothetical protein
LVGRGCPVCQRGAQAVVSIMLRKPSERGCRPRPVSASAWKVGRPCYRCSIPQPPAGTQALRLKRAIARDAVRHTLARHAAPDHISSSRTDFESPQRQGSDGHVHLKFSTRHSTYTATPSSDNCWHAGCDNQLQVLYMAVLFNPVGP